MGGGRGCGGRRPWFPCCENIEWFVVSDVHIFRRCRSENSDTSLYLKLWYSFYICVKYQRLHENNLAQRAQLMWLPLRCHRASAATTTIIPFVSIVIVVAVIVVISVLLVDY